LTLLFFKIKTILQQFLYRVLRDVEGLLEGFDLVYEEGEVLADVLREIFGLYFFERIKIYDLVFVLWF
jgi:hypothetical protein